MTRANLGPADKEQEAQEAQKAQHAQDQSNNNPFIKFRQFADAKISSLLQGVIGLPSTFNRSPGNTHWADVDEDLRRRDELHSRQNALRMTEQRRRMQNEADGGQEVAIPVKTSADWDSSITRREGTGIGDNTTDDWPLYSRVSKSLFRHLVGAAEDNVEWGQCHPLFDLPDDEDELPAGWERKVNSFGRTYFVDHNTRSTTWSAGAPYLYLLRPDQKSHDISRMVQHMAFNNLNKTARASLPYWGGLSLHSGNSLLPYLLFSAYSPINLQRSSEEPAYRDAFEDLLAMHNGLPLGRDGRREHLAIKEIEQTAKDDDIDIAKKNMSWIYTLKARGILTQPKLPSEVATDFASPFLRPDIMGDILRPFRKSEPEDNDQNTEQDMYDHFLRSASSAASTSVGLVDSLFSDAERFIQDLTEGTRKDQDQSEDTKTVTKTFYERKPAGEATKPSGDADRVVSTITSSEHITHEDGRVETNVTVRRRFADGRETVTEKSHIEHPRNDVEDRIDEIQQPNRSGKNPENENKGWFWKK
ncbi:hypothetical protein BP6252_00273 [Coleophoma cylindrospora]|uniref:WW domain-containing protein n=1 Tax=Coleophoma cylindrospora TaxID=1849047 RepID=A0A3D8SPZ4_9HELO|nr:hypothetical protein BP6252_00273 [Coleophoma cylindrospora]